MKFFKFIKRQVKREFFGTLGFVSGTAILIYGTFFPRVVPIAPASVTNFNNYITIPLAGIGVIIIVMSFIVLLIRYSKR